MVIRSSRVDHVATPDFPEKYAMMGIHYRIGEKPYFDPATEAVDVNGMDLTETGIT